MLRLLAIAAMFAFAVPTLASAQNNNNDHRRPGPPGKPMVRPGPGPVLPPRHGPPGRIGRSLPGSPVGPQISYRGHMINRLHIAPYAYPPGFAYRRWGVGAVLPPAFLVPGYYYANWAGLGLAPPPPGYQWVRYGPDLLLVNTRTGQITDTVYGVFY